MPAPLSASEAQDLETIDHLTSPPLDAEVLKLHSRRLEALLPSNSVWNQTVTFDSSMAGFPSSGVTHIIVTKSDEVTGGIAYVTFDDFCLQLTSPSNWNPGDVVSTPIGNPRPDPQDVAELSTCCPPLTGGANGQMPNFFNATAHQANGDYNMQFSTSSPQYTQFASGYQAYIGLLGATSGGSIKKLDVGWYLYEVMPDGSWGPLLETIYSSFKVSTPIVAPTGFTTPLKPNHKYVIKAYTYSWNGRQAGEYGFQELCNSGDQFAFQWGISNGRSRKPGLAISPVTGTPGSKPVLPAR